MHICKLLPDQNDFDFWINNNLNVLFVGGPGCGKTTMMVEAFTRHKLNFKYFSAATMDPWVDFIGVPQEQEDAKGKYLALIKPKEFRDDEIEALFFDEFNRSPKKVRNAVMELLQFKSINGKKYNNLRMVWAAINPHDENETFDVEKLDPAQLDRFQIHIELPQVPNSGYFTHKFGREKAEVAIEWWKKLPDEAKSYVTPRRLEESLKIHGLGGNISHVLPSNSGVDILKKNLMHGSPRARFIALIKKEDKAGLKNMLKDQSTFDYLQSEIKTHLDKVFDVISEENQSAILASNKHAWDIITKEPQTYKNVIETLSKTGNKEIKNKAKGILDGLIRSDPKKASVSTSSSNNLDEILRQTIVRNSTKKLLTIRDNRFWKVVFPASDKAWSSIEYKVSEIEYNFENRMIDALAKPYSTYEYRNILQGINSMVLKHGTYKPESLCTVINCLAGKLQVGRKGGVDGLNVIMTSGVLQRIIFALAIKPGAMFSLYDIFSAYPNLAKIYHECH